MVISGVIHFLAKGEEEKLRCVEFALPRRQKEREDPGAGSAGGSIDALPRVRRLHVSRLLLAAFASALLRLPELRLFAIGSHTHTVAAISERTSGRRNLAVNLPACLVSRISENAVLNAAAKSSDTAPSKCLSTPLDGWS